jgi:hypothetical protein
MIETFSTLIAGLVLVGSIGGIVFAVRQQRRTRTSLKTPVISSEAITIIMSFVAFLAIAYLIAQMA